MMKKSSYRRRMVALIGSSGFFWGITALLAVQAVWIALTARYPMAFDEDFHLGLIRLYAHHISPFWSSQPAGGDVYGAVARDPSYLYQYLMSFPYRLVSSFTHNQTTVVLWLRGINIILLGSSLVFYRRLLLKTGTSRAIVHSCLLVFVLIPVVPLLAAQINYDNLLIPLTGLILLLVIRFDEELERLKRLNIKQLLTILILCLLTSLVQYAFLPIFVAIVVYLLVRLWQIFRHWHAFWMAVNSGVKQTRRRTLTGLALALVLAGGLFGERYGINLVRYHTPVPACSQVLSVRECRSYGPWIRDYDYAINRVDEEKNPAVFTADWVYGMWLRLFFAVGGPGTGFETRGPLFIPAIGSVVFSGGSALFIIRYARRIKDSYNASVLGLWALVSACYITALWLDEYLAYVRTGQPVAINGRYLLPVLLPLLVFAALGWRELLQRRPRLKVVVFYAAIVSLLWGGGALTYVLRSNDAWYWPSPAARTLNHAVQRTLGPLTPGYRNPDAFL
jgi:hypothetical protein